MCLVCTPTAGGREYAFKTYDINCYFLIIRNYLVIFRSLAFLVSELEYIAVTIGPGTFAGVRIGLSAAKGMGLALAIPVIAVTTLEAIAYQYACEHEAFSGIIAVAIDARRGEVYLQSFELNKGACAATSKPEAIALNSVKDKLAEDVTLLLGSAGDLLKDIPIKHVSGYDHPNAAFIARMAVGIIERAQTSDDVAPLYLRAPDAIKPAPLNMIVRDE